MAKKSKIEWLQGGSTWNPWYCCTEISPGCDHCYSRSWAARAGKAWGLPIRAANASFYAPMNWRDPRLVFVCSLSDFAHQAVSPIWRREAYQVMRQAAWHTYIFVTKRVTAMAEYWQVRQDATPYPNRWLLATAEDQQRADERIPALLAIPAAVHGVSIEPMLGPVDVSPWLRTLHADDIGADWKREHVPAFQMGESLFPPSDSTPWYNGLDWVIVGGETGAGHRAMNPDWAIAVRDQCKASRTPFFFKKLAGGAEPPAYLNIRQMPRRPAESGVIERKEIV